MSHAIELARAALLTEVVELKSRLPDTETTKRNVAAIESKMPPDKMDWYTLVAYVDLLYRSVT